MTLLKDQIELVKYIFKTLLVRNKCQFQTK